MNPKQGDLVMKGSKFTLTAIIVSFVYWMADAIIHKFVYLEEFEFIPSDVNELWMRALIILLLVGFSMYADRHARIMLEKENEKRRIFKATIYSTQHILNNLMQQMQYFKMLADEANAFDDETIELYESSIKQGRELVEKLSSVDDLTEENIRKSVHPEHVK